MLTLQEISDRFEITDLLVDYSMAIDSGDWDALDALFTEDAHIDYTATGGIAGDLAEIKAYLPGALGHFTSTQHLTGPTKLIIDGDRATGRTICHNPMTLPATEDGSNTLVVGLWYVDRFVRTEAGWRIAERTEELSSFAHMTGGFPERR